MNRKYMRPTVAKHDLYEPFDPIDEKGEITDIIHQVNDRISELTSLAAERGETCASAGLDRLATDFKYIAAGLNSIPHILRTANLRRLDNELENGRKTTGNLLMLAMKVVDAPLEGKPA